jgi:hypothetical protein
MAVTRAKYLASEYSFSRVIFFKYKKCSHTPFFLSLLTVVAFLFVLIDCGGLFF